MLVGLVGPERTPDQEWLVRLGVISCLWTGEAVSWALLAFSSGREVQRVKDRRSHGDGCNSRKDGEDVDKFCGSLLMSCCVFREKLREDLTTVAGNINGLQGDLTTAGDQQGIWISETKSWSWRKRAQVSQARCADAVML